MKLMRARKQTLGVLRDKQQCVGQKQHADSKASAIQCRSTSNWYATKRAGQAGGVPRKGHPRDDNLLATLLTRAVRWPKPSSALRLSSESGVVVTGIRHAMRLLLLSCRRRAILHFFTSSSPVLKRSKTKVRAPFPSSATSSDIYPFLFAPSARET